MFLLEFPDDAGPGPTACLNLYRRLAAGVTVVTALGPNGPIGMTASSVTSVSLRPPLILVSLAHQSRTLAAIRARRAFAVHLLRSDQRQVAEQFAGLGDSRFTDVATEEVLGVPVLKDVLARSVCLLQAEHPYGDHSLIIGQVAAAHVGAGKPLLWHNREFAELTALAG